MESVKSEIISNLEKLRNVSRYIKTHLQNIIDQNLTVVKVIEDLTLKELSDNKSYYLEVTSQQYSTIQKLLVVNTEFEEHLSIYGNNVTNIETKQTNESSTEITDTFSESSRNDDISGNLADSSDFTERGGLKPFVIDRLKRFNLLSRRERDRLTIRKQSLSELSLIDDTEKNSRKYKYVRKKTREIGAEVKKVEVKTVNEVKIVEDAKIVEDVKLTEENIVEPQQKKVAEVKILKVLAEPPEPFLGMRCLISHMKSPSEFYINPSDENIQKLENISVDVLKIYGSSYTPYKTKSEAKENLGDYCLCYIDKFGYWYRAQVTNWHMRAWGYRENVVTVFLVDFGYSSTTSYTNLRELLDHHCSIPKYAIKCHLNKLRPFGAININSPGDWPVKTIETMNEIIGTENENIFKIEFVDRETDSYAVDLVIDTPEENSPTIALQLIERGVATGMNIPRKTIKPLKDVIDKSSTSSDADLVDALYEKDKKNINVEVFIDETINETKPCFYFLRTGYCGRRYCKYNHSSNYY